MASRIVELIGLEGFNTNFEYRQQKKPVIMFSATKKEDGTPWCPDCKDGEFSLNDKKLIKFK